MSGLHRAAVEDPNRVAGRLVALGDQRADEGDRLLGLLGGRVAPGADRPDRLVGDHDLGEAARRTLGQVGLELASKHRLGLTRRRARPRSLRRRGSASAPPRAPPAPCAPAPRRSRRTGRGARSGRGSTPSTPSSVEHRGRDLAGERARRLLVHVLRRDPHRAAGAARRPPRPATGTAGRRPARRGRAPPPAAGSDRGRPPSRRPSCASSSWRRPAAFAQPIGQATSDASISASTPGSFSPLHQLQRGAAAGREPVDPVGEPERRQRGGRVAAADHGHRRARRHGLGHRAGSGGERLQLEGAHRARSRTRCPRRRSRSAYSTRRARADVEPHPAVGHLDPVELAALGIGARARARARGRPAAASSHDDALGALQDLAGELDPAPPRPGSRRSAIP